MIQVGYSLPALILSSEPLFDSGGNAEQDDARQNYSHQALPSSTRCAQQGRIFHRLQLFPQLADVGIDYAWGGYVDITMNRAPDFGRVAPNVYYLQGFSGHGIALTGMAGQLVAETVAGQAERFDLFAQLQHRDFPGGRLFRMPALVLAMLWFRLKDLL